MDTLNDTLSTVAGWVRDARRVVVLTGAGISTESGIPDFRGPQGVWTKNPEAEKYATLSYYMSDPEIRVRAWRHRLESPMWEAQPGRGHLAVTELERKGKLDTVVTQNVDGLHHKAGTSPERIVEVHGNVREVVCMSCDERAPVQAALDRVRAGEDDPPCRTCGGILKTATISFGQNLDPAVMARAEAAAAGADVFLAVGTTLVVYPVAWLPEYALRAGAKLVIVNAEPTPYDPQAHAVINDEIGEVLPRIADLV